VLNDAFYIIGLKEAMRTRKTRRKQLPTRESQENQSLATENNLGKIQDNANQEALQSKNSPYILFSAALITYTDS
jgi:hypothetical protein